MSTFTSWNGPGAGHGPRTADVLALIEAYNNMNALLSKHIESTATDDVHKFNTALQSAISTLETSVNTLLNAKASTDTVSALSSSVSELENKLNIEVSRAQSIENEVANSVSSEVSRAQEQEDKLNSAISELESAFTAFKELIEQRTQTISFDDDVTTTITGIVDATEAVIGKIQVRNSLDYVEWKTLRAQFAGVGSSESGTKNNGVYVLGRLSETWNPDQGFTDTLKQKPARIYIKYINDRPFDLVVDISATGAKHGVLTCSASFQKVWTEEDSTDAWEDMALHLLSNTDSSGATHIYLGISARGLNGQSTIFHVAGENFEAGGTINGVSNRIAFTRVKAGLNAYRANFDDLRVNALYDEQGSSILSVAYKTKLDAPFTAQKILFVADEEYEEVIFKRRPSIIFEEGDEHDTKQGYVAPFLTSYDLDALSAGAALKGTIVFWAQFEEATVNGTTVKRAINVPEGYIACDGSEVSLEAYPELRGIFGLDETATTVTLPAIDYAIMRVVDLFANVELDAEARVKATLTHAELTYAVQALRKDLIEESETREEADEILQSNIDAEEAARIEADNNLQANLNAETEARIEADNNLQANLNAETEARIEADNNLQANLNAETEARIAADNQIQANLDTEAATRQAADEQLQSNIDAEAATRLASDTQLQENLDAEEAARIAADNQLQANLDIETSERKAADEVLQQNIDSEAQARREADSSLQTLLDAETSNRITADSTFQTQLEAEITARQNADTSLQTAIDAEIVARREADTQLQSSIDTEASARATMDNTLQEAINAEATTRQTADNALQEAINEEATTRQTADNSLQEAINEEATTRQTSDNALTEAINSEASARENADNSLQEAINSEASTREAKDNELQSLIDDYHAESEGQNSE